MRIVVGPVLLWTSKREDSRLANGITYEPETFVERRNWVMKDKKRRPADIVTMHPRDAEQRFRDVAAACVATNRLGD